MLPPASGTGVYRKSAPKVIRLLRQGCTNRPFFHVVVGFTRAHQRRPVIEQVGSYDPLPNQHNEKLVALNFERIRFWIGNGAAVSQPVEQLLGLAGFYPIHPTSYMQAWRNRQRLEADRLNEMQNAESQEQKSESTSQ